VIPSRRSRPQTLRIGDGAAVWTEKDDEEVEYGIVAKCEMMRGRCRKADS
jgi:hypothetical protein